jgi:hypothetical protein
MKERNMNPEQDLSIPNKMLNKTQYALLTAHREEFNIDEMHHYFSSIDRANLFHNILSFGDDLRIAVYNGSGDMKVYDVIANNKEDAQSFDDVVAQRDRIFKAYSEKMKSRDTSQEEREHYTHIMRTAKANYRYWPKVELIQEEFIPLKK